MTDPAPRRLPLWARIVSPILRRVIRLQLRALTSQTLRELYARATTELHPDAAETAREMIRAELSRRYREDY